MNETTNIFEIATKNKYRFPFRGMISVEDLWDLNMEQLDLVYKSMKKVEKEVSVEGLFDHDNSGDIELRTKLEIVKYIFNTKQLEVEAKKKETENAKKRQQLLEILAKKQDDSLQNLSEEEILKMLEELN